MKKFRWLNPAVDAGMFLILIAQMLYVFLGNTAHELLGIFFFVLLIAHAVLKRRWFAGLLKARRRSALQWAFSGVTLLLLLAVLALMVSGMGVSRLLFPDFGALGSAALHRLLATAVLALAVLHAGLRFCLRPGKMKTKIALTALGCGLAVAFGLALVPYLNRHLKTVEISYAQAVAGDKVAWTGKKPLVVYFTRLGNTDFAADADAVSGASLLLADGERMGNAQLLARMAADALDCDMEAITLTGEKYPSSYNDTVAVAQKELRQQARPPVAAIDLGDADTVILVYPLWWGTLPMPVASFLESVDWTGKTLCLLATQGSSGFGASTRDIQALAPGATVVEGLSVYCDDVPTARQQIGRWLETL